MRVEVGESSSMLEDGSKIPLWSLMPLGRFWEIWWRETGSKEVELKGEGKREGKGESQVGRTGRGGRPR